MKAPLVVACVLLVSCGTAVKRPLRVAQVSRPEAASIAREPEVEREDSAEEAAAFYLLRRTGGAPLPVDRLLSARRHARTMPHYSVAARRFVAPRAHGAAPREANLGGWQPLGPGNVGGRTRALVVRPDDANTMYAGAAGGGVWKTTDGGQTWNPLTDLLPSIAIGTLAMDPQAPDTLYAGTGEWFTSSAARGNQIRGAGIFKTTDGGAAWSQLPATANDNFNYVNKLVVSPNNSLHIYAATYGGIWYSPDAGASWVRVLNRSGNLLGCQDLVIRTDQPADYLFAACADASGTNPGIYRNTDAAGGGSWQMVFTTDNMARTTLALAPSSQSTIYALSASSENENYANGLLGVFRSTSNGDADSWATQVSNQDATLLNTVLLSNVRDAFADACNTGTRNFDHNQGRYDNAIAVDPTNPDVVWAAGIDIFRSDDGGRNWGIAAFWEAAPPQLAHADNHLLVFHPGYNGADNQTLFAANDGGIYRTDNATAATATGPRAACRPYNTSVAWTQLNNGYAVTQFYHGGMYPGAAGYIGGTQDNGTQRGSDASGPIWAEAIGGDGGFSAIDPTDPNTWYGETTELSLRKTTNGGATFTASTRGITELASNFQFIAPFVMDPGEPKRLYIGGRTLWRTIDAAANWAEASSQLPAANGNITAIAISPTDPNRVVFGTSAGFVHRSNAALAAGRSTAWPSSQPRTGYISGLAFDPVNPDIVYATYSQYKQFPAQAHVYRSTDGGGTWTGIDGTGSTGLPDIPVFSLLPDPQTPATLYLGTDIGVFVSLDSGATWARDDNPFADTVTETLALDRSNGQSRLIAFTHGRGVWKTALPDSGAPCTFSVSTNAIALPAFGADAAVGVTAADGCTWSAFSSNSSFTVSSPSTGLGSGSFKITSFFLNNTPNPLSSTVSVQDQAISVVQAAALMASGNDDAAAPFPVGTLPAVVIQNTGDATEAASDPTHSCSRSADSKTLWFSLVTPDPGTAHLTLTNRRLDNGFDAGTTLTLYRVTNGAVGPEFGCTVVPQSGRASGATGLQWTTRAGDRYLIEVSATTSGAPAGAAIQPGNLTLRVSLTS